MTAVSPAVTKQEFPGSLCPIIAGHIMMANLTHRAGELFPVMPGSLLYSHDLKELISHHQSLLITCTPGNVVNFPEMKFILQSS